MASTSEFGCDELHGCEKALFLAIGDDNWVDRIGIVVVEDKDIIVAGERRADEATSLVGEGTPGDFNVADIDVVGAEVDWIGLKLCGIGGCCRICEGKRAGFGALGGADVGAMRVAVALDGCL